MTDDAGMRHPTKYQSLAAEVCSWIDSGMFAPGEPLPSITDLAADRGWARQTCARAYQTLEAKGRVARFPGSGYHVATLPRGQRRELVS